MEQWLPVVGFSEYAVSNLGRVKRVIADKKNHVCRVLKPWLNNKGYQIVNLCDSSGQKKHLVSRIVCAAFHGAAPTEKHEVAHNDGDQSNNYAQNLRWATRSENMEDSRKHGTMAIGSRHGRTTKPEKTPRGEKHGHAKITDAEVRLIRSINPNLVTGRTIAQAFGISPACVSNIRSKKTWRHIA